MRVVWNEVVLKIEKAKCALSVFNTNLQIKNKPSKTLSLLQLYTGLVLQTLYPKKQGERVWRLTWSKLVPASAAVCHLVCRGMTTGDHWWFYQRDMLTSHTFHQNQFGMSKSPDSLSAMREAGFQTNRYPAL